MPLPRNVGLASDDELFCVKIQALSVQNPDELLGRIAEELPGGFELVSAAVTEKPVTYQPVEVEYLVRVNPSEKMQQFLANIKKLNEQIQAGRQILIERTLDQKGSVKTVDVGKFLKPFEITQQGIRVFCKVFPTGTIRPDEILKLLKMETHQISSEVIRKQITWQINT